MNNKRIISSANTGRQPLGILFLAVAVVLAGFIQPASAASFFNALVPDVTNFFEDQDREVIVDVDSSGSVTTGDVFIGFARIDNRSVPPGFSFNNDDLYAVFSITVEAITAVDFDFNGIAYRNYNIAYGPTTQAGLDIGSLIGETVPAGSLAALYEDVGLDLFTFSPGDVDGDGSLSMLDFVAKIAQGNLDLTIGYRDNDDHWVASAAGPAAADAIGDLTILNSATLSGGIPNAISFHAGLSILASSSLDHSFAKGVPDVVDNPQNPTLHDLTVQNGDVSGASDLNYNGVNPFFTDLGYPTYGLSTNADYGVFPATEQKPGACRMTGGNATVFPFTGSDGLQTWSYEFESPADEGWITTGGQINAPSGNTPPAGHWEHTLHGGSDGVFSFHAGTASAPPGTEISSVECADVGWCVQARCAPFKQLFWTGIGNFANQRFDYDFGSCNVVPTRGNQGSLHFVRVMIGDFGENDRPTREAALLDANPESCDWFDKIGGPPGPWTASEAIELDHVTDPKFGSKGGQVCDKCPDYYQIEIYCGTTPDLAGGEQPIYSFHGYLDSGNYQIHPETGTQCPLTEELIPELFESTTTKTSNGKKK